MKARKINDVAILAPQGWLMGGDETDAFEQAVQETLDGGARHLIIDLGDAQMLNSTALGVLAHCHRTCEERGGRMVLCNVDQRIAHTLVITKLALRFDTYPSERSALEALTVAA